MGQERGAAPRATSWDSLRTGGGHGMEARGQGSEGGNPGALGQNRGGGGGECANNCNPHVPTPPLPGRCNCPAHALRGAAEGPVTSPGGGNGTGSPAHPSAEQQARLPYLEQQRGWQGPGSRAGPLSPPRPTAALLQSHAATTIHYLGTKGGRNLVMKNGVSGGRRSFRVIYSAPPTLAPLMQLFTLSLKPSFHSLF